MQNLNILRYQQLLNNLNNNINNQNMSPLEYFDSKLDNRIAYDYTPENWRNWNDVRNQEIEDWFKQHHPIRGYFKYDAPFPISMVDDAIVEFANLKNNYINAKDLGKQ